MSLNWTEEMENVIIDMIDEPPLSIRKALMDKFDIELTRNQVVGKRFRLKQDPELLNRRERERYANSKPVPCKYEDLPSTRLQRSLSSAREKQAADRARTLMRAGDDPSTVARDLRDTLDFPASRAWVLHNAC
jgi:hypothetical protein